MRGGELEGVGIWSLEGGGLWRVRTSLIFSLESLSEYVACTVRSSCRGLKIEARA